jgi:hypothetical protein
MAADIGEKPVTVRQWRARNSIPPTYWPTIIARAADKGAELTWTMFLPSKSIDEAEAA